MMKYKGYSGVIEIDEDSGVLFGDVIGLRDVITFQGETVPQARQAFQDSVDDYLEFCASRNEPPEKPFSGKFLIRIAPALHRMLVNESLARGMSLNTLVERTLAAEFAGAATQAPDEETTGASNHAATREAATHTRRRKAAAKVAAGDQAKSPASQTKVG